VKAARLAPLSGIFFVVLLFIGFGPLGGNTPNSDAPGPEINSYYNDHQTREIVAAVLVGIAVVFLALFVIALRDHLRGADGAGDFWPTLALVGGAVSIAGFFVAIGIHVALVDGADQNISPPALVALNSLDNWDFFGFAIPLALMMFGSAGAILGGAALPRWLGWVSLAIGILYFAGPAGFFAFLLTGIWIIVVSVLIYRSGPATA
jgi:hypothetical protein